MIKKFDFKILILFCVGTIYSYSSFSQTENAGFELNITSPDDISGTYQWSASSGWGGSVEADFCGQLVWAENGAETEGCNPLAASSDLTDKIALIRRGTCDFSLKAYHAQLAGAKALVVVNHLESGDPEEFITMLGGDSAAIVDIPVVFITYNSGLLIIPFLAEGNEVEICFEFPTFNFAFGPYAYFTPQSEIIPLDNIQVRVNNRRLPDMTGIETKLQITDPNGTTTELVAVHDAPNGEDVDVTFDSYTPSEIGKYEMKYISGNDGKEIVRAFEITEHTWGMDNGVITRAIGPSPAQFQEANFFYQFANLILPASDAVVTHVSFGIGNAAEVFVGDPSADLILIGIYDADKNSDGAVDDFSNFDGLGDPIEIGFYEMDGSETFDNLVTVPLDSPLQFEAGGIYYVSLAYDGLNAATGIAPSFSASSRVEYLGFPSTPLQTDQLFGGGWASGTLALRLHTEGFVTSTKDIVALAEDKVTILSNPVVNNEVRFQINLEKSNNRVDVLFRNLDGKLIKQLKYENVQNISDQINVVGLPAGTYFLNVNTEEGFRSKKVVISK